MDMRSRIGCLGRGADDGPPTHPGSAIGHVSGVERDSERRIAMHREVLHNRPHMHAWAGGHPPTPACCDLALAGGKRAMQQRL